MARFLLPAPHVQLKGSDREKICKQIKHSDCTVRIRRIGKASEGFICSASQNFSRSGQMARPLIDQTPEHASTLALFPLSNNMKLIESRIEMVIRGFHVLLLAGGGKSTSSPTPHPSRVLSLVTQDITNLLISQPNLDLEIIPSKVYRMMKSTYVSASASKRTEE